MEGDSCVLKVSLNLLIDTKTQRVLSAEADKKAVDFLFNILTLPMATVIKLLTKQEMAGCVANLYESVKNLNDTHIIQPTKQSLLNPLTFCLSQEDGFVKEGGMYVIMDDLLVKPADSAIALLTKMNANELGKLRVQESRGNKN